MSLGLATLQKVLDGASPNDPTVVRADLAWVRADLAWDLCEVGSYGPCIWSVHIRDPAYGQCTRQTQLAAAHDPCIGEGRRSAHHLTACTPS
jgi:hypothetical protein